MIRIFVVFMIVSQKMQKTMNDQVGNMGIERLVRKSRFSPDRFKTKHDVADQAGRRRRLRERQDVGRTVYAAPLPVQFAHRRIVGKN